jgi:hypothetical protein
MTWINKEKLQRETAQKFEICEYKEVEREENCSKQNAAILKSLHNTKYNMK